MKLEFGNMVVETSVGSGVIALTYTVNFIKVMSTYFNIEDIRKFRDMLTKLIVIAEVEKDMDKDEKV